MMRLLPSRSSRPLLRRRCSRQARSSESLSATGAPTSAISTAPRSLLRPLRPRRPPLSSPPRSRVRSPASASSPVKLRSCRRKSSSSRSTPGPSRRAIQRGTLYARWARSVARRASWRVCWRSSRCRIAPFRRASSSVCPRRARTGSCRPRTTTPRTSGSGGRI